jgi:nucleoside-diphosphate-sugar epimerase
VNPEVLIIGCGFLGEAAADLFLAGGKKVLGIVRSPESTHASARSHRNFSAESPFRIACCDVTDPASVEALAPQVRGVPLAIYAVSSGRGGAEAYAAIYRDGLRRILEKWNPGKVLFVSSTSVYGQCDGSWVTEESAAIPGRETGRILLEAEQIALSSGGGVARLSGIYGPGRSVLLRKFLTDEARLEDGGGRWINQIHRDDAAAALLRLGDPALPSGIFNVSDNVPATQREVYGWMAEFLQRPLPPEGPRELNRKRGWTSKRISNGLLQSLGWRPKFPSYREALPQLTDWDMV